MRRFALLLFAIFVCVFAQADKKIVQVNLVANWQEAPLQYEISEFLKENENKLLWKMLKDVQTDKTEDFLAYCKQHLSNEQYSLLEYALTIHYFSPKVQIQRQFLQETLASLTESLQTKVKSCTSWVHLNNQVACTSDELLSLLSSYDSAVNPTAQDTVYPSSSSSGPTAFFYASLGSTSSLHTLLADLANQGKLVYTLRYNLPESTQQLPLAGYGVDLAIKSLEYKSVDDTKVEGSESQGGDSIEDEEEETQGFLFGVLKKRKPELSNELSAFKSYLTGSNIQFESLKVWNLKDLGYQAAQRIVSAANPLKLMKDLSQNFPNHAVALSRVKVNDTFKAELQNSRLLPEGESLALINGRIIHLESVNPFQLYTIMQEENFKLNSLLTLKISKPDAFKILSTAADKSPVDTFQIPTNAPITFINDLENDPQYQGWPRSVTEIFRRVWPGSFRYIAKNFYTSVTFVNAGSPQTYELMSVLDSVIGQNVPIRFGFVLSTMSYEEIASIMRSDPSKLDVVEDSIATTIAKVFYHVRDEYGARAAVGFMRMLSAVTDINQETIQASLDNTLLRWTSQKVKVKSVVKATTWDSLIIESNKLIYQMGIDASPASFLNGQYISSFDSQSILQETIGKSFDQVGKLQDLVKNGHIRDHSNAFEVLMKQKDLLSHFSSLILPSQSNPLKFINLIQSPSPLPAKYYLMSPEDGDTTKAVTHLLVLDLTRANHVAFLLDAMSFLKTKPQETRLGLIFSDVGAQSLLPVSMYAAMDTQLQRKAFNFIDALVSEFSKENSITHDQVLKIAEEQNLNMEKFTKALDNDYSQLLSQQAQFTQEVKVTVPSIITNGRVITLESVFTVEDWKFLGEFERKSRANGVLSIVSMATIEGVDSESQTSEFFSDIVMAAVSIIGIDQQNNIEKLSLPPQAKISLVLSQDKPETFLITCIINPLSAAAQRFTPILEALSSFFDVKIQLIFNPKDESNLPLKNFYQYVLPTSLKTPPTAKFTNLPTQRLLTLSLDTPEAWLVTPTIARYDLDNIKLEDMGSDKILFAQFELKNIIMEGNCYEYGNPPRGLELMLHSNTSSTVQDTIVMSNYGYFQLKANPGVWELQLKENSRSKLIYQFAGDAESKIVLDSYEGLVKHVNVQKKPERAHEQLLSDEPTNNYWGSISNLWPGKTTASAANESDTIHVFSLASGHLYERFLKIMMLTVTRNTKSHVKFWLLANFLSPKFKDFIPHMAKQYGFEYELVTYKWPSWLHKQTEKQRIIWGYKILFLDVLFPLDLKKVIYVDADQIVKADLKELWDMNLEGAPYAYTPFCRDKPEMDGFKFWNQGFWANHLRGLPYHISALYVVDLVQFRKMAAGDILRSNYDQLSQDPNSLANLDQDLPNYLQHQVKIFSLPPEWLWCETWCSDGSKEAAKTIDLCNNPLTKIPKLDNAVKVIPEWTNMDNEIKALENQVLSKGSDNVDQAILAMEQAQISL